MSLNKIITQGFGTGAVYGTPTTIGLAPTTTLSITSALAGQYFVAGLAAGVQLKLVSTANGVTDSISILDGAPGFAFLDGISAFAVNTTTSVTLKFIGL